jgi:hypothetical protein
VRRSRTEASMSYDSLAEFFSGVWQGVISYSPRLLVAALLLVAGWGVAFVLRWLVVRLVARSARLAPAGAVESAVKESGIDRVAVAAVGEVVFWGVILLFIAAAGQVLGLIVITSALSRLAQYLPNVLAALLVVFAGIVVAKLARAAVAGAAGRARIEHGEFLGQAARVMILLVAALVALDQIGIESTVLMLVLGIILGTVIGGAALAFGLGARDAVRGFIAANDLHQVYHVGDQVRVGEIEGRIIRFTRTAVLLDTTDGRARVPAGEFGARTSFLVEGRSS